MAKDIKNGMTEAQKKAVNKYQSEKVELIRFWVPKGDKDKIRSHAEKHGESLSAFIVRAIRETMLRDDT